MKNYEIESVNLSLSSYINESILFSFVMFMVVF